MKNNNRDIAVPLILLVIYLYQITLEWPISSAKMPRILLVIIGTFTVILLITGEIATKKQSNSNKDNNKEGLKKISYSRLFTTMIATFLYIGLIDILGFYLTSFIFFICMLIYFNLKKNFMLLVVTLITLIGIYSVFSLWLRVPVPKGILF